MRRERIEPRRGWQQRCEESGFVWHSMDGVYWDESACYTFSAAQIDELEATIAELHRLCLAAADEVVRSRRYAQFAIPEAFHEFVETSWRRREPDLYGRFDLSWGGTGPAKLLEYNADTPTALPEASVVQWQWLEDRHPQADQFNSLHEKLIARWRALAPAAGGGVLHLACVRDNAEDLGNAEYLRDCALQAGWDARQIFIEELGWNGRSFVDLDAAPVRTLFKLYPWEWLVREDFGAHLHRRAAQFVEPPWKMLLSNKALLAILWEMNPGHPNLLPAFFDPQRFAGDYVKKPLLAREGANVTMRRGGSELAAPGGYGAEGYIYQQIALLPEFSGCYPVIGAWVVGDEPAGIGIREDDTPITRNTSRFVPHYFQ